MAEIIPFPTKEKYNPEDWEEMVVITVYQSGRTTCWLSYDIETDEQYEWATRTVMNGVDAITEMKEEKNVQS